MSRRHKPALILTLTGSKHARPVADPQADGEIGPPPDWLSPSQVECWEFAVANAPRGLLRRIDREVLAAWAVQAATFSEANEKIARHSSLLIKTPDGLPIQSPYLSIRNRALTLLLKCSSELGFSPSGRAGLSAAQSNQFANNGRRPPSAA